MPAPTAQPPLTLDERFCGPPRSGNGGYTSGALAARLAGPGGPAVEVTLRRPPPLAVPMAVEAADGQAVLRHGETLVAEARCLDDEPAPVPPVAVEEAARAAAGYPGLRRHPFPTCFACGPGRAEGDGLRIFPGPVDGGRVAAPWTPHRSLAAPGEQRVEAATAWAALDCVGGWSCDLENRPMVLGRMTARFESRPVVGEPHVVVGAHRGSEGRRTFTASTLYDAAGQVVGRAEHVWVEVDVTRFGGSS